MANRQQEQQHQQQQKQQHKQRTERRGRLQVYSFWTICITVLLLARLDSSGGVDALSISLNGNGNRLQQQQQQQVSEAQSTQQQLQHLQDNEEEHNYIMQKSTTEQVPNNGEIVEDNDEIALKGNGINSDLTRGQLNIGYPFRTLNMIKRAPGGFVGMRGKKDDFVDDDVDDGDVDNDKNNDDVMDNDGYDNLAFPWQQLSNNEIDLLNWDDYTKPNVRRYKKAPTAFYGVRGKKFSMGNSVNPSGDLYRWQQFIERMDEDRVREMIMNDFMNGLLNGNGKGNVQSEMSKRAPTGFTGVRGKRPALTEDAGGDSSLESVGKRGVGNAFVGVRGKKDVSHQTYKRSPLGGGSESSASGAGGKRYNFGNKFVAVRGKKNSDDFLNDNQMSTNDWTNFAPNNFRWSPLSSSLASGRGVGGADASMRLMFANSGKRAPTGFMGMRGKRPLTSADDMLADN